jgi:hypothetical protein
MQRRSEKHWLAFLASVERLNDFRKPGVLRRYQERILELGRLEIVSPFSGNTLSVVCSDRIGSAIAYQFFDQERFWIITGPMQFAYPLSHLVDDRDGDIRQLIPSMSPLDTKHQRAINEHLRSGPPATEVARTVPVLIIGHPNFAHHLWNELSALDEWLNTASDEAIAGLKIVATAEPFGPLRNIFPQLERASFLSVAEIASIKQMCATPLFVRTGSRLVTTRVRQTICDFSESHANRPIADSILGTLTSGSPRIWISVRMKTRTADNQLELILAVLRRVFRTYSNATVAIDGFSYPMGFFDDLRKQKVYEGFVTRAEEAGEFITAIRSQVIAELGQHIGSRLCSISGLSLADAIHIGSCCDYYICHVGTLQHKIGWLHTIPGFIHFSPQGTTSAQWHANQVEGGIIPDFLPANLAVSTSAAVSKRSASRNFNYRVTDVDQAADLIIQSMRLRLSAR